MALNKQELFDLEWVAMRSAHAEPADELLRLRHFKKAVLNALDAQESENDLFGGEPARLKLLDRLAEALDETASP